MQFEWDEAKRVSNIAKHRLDFRDAVLVFRGDNVILEGRVVGDEIRKLAVGWVRANLVTVVYTERGGAIRVISMRRARTDERARHQAVHR